MFKFLSVATFRAIALMAIASSVLACTPTSSGGGGDDDGGDTITTNADHNAMLSKLLKSSIDTSGPKDASGRSLREDYNPFGTSKAILSKESELYMVGCDIDGGTSTRPSDYSTPANAFFDGKNAFLLDANHISPYSVFPWGVLPKKIAGADVDGDGRDEICVVYLGAEYTPSGGNASRKLMLSIYDGQPSATNAIIEDQVLASYESSAINAFYNYNFYDLWNASSDIKGGMLKGNSEAQLVISAMGKLFLIGGASDGYAALDTYDSFANGGALQILKIACGDLDGDGEDEIAAIDGVLTNTSQSVLNGLARLYCLNVDSAGKISVDAALAGETVTASTATIYSGSIAAGDVDADGLAEIVVCGNSSLGTAIVAVFDDANADYKFMTWGNTDKSNYCRSVAAAVIDYDGDGVKEIIGYTRLFESANNLNADSTLKVVNSDFAGGTGMYEDDCIAVGQFNDSSTTVDTHEDFAFIPWGEKDMWICTWDADNVATNYETNLWDKGNYQYYPCLASANVDDDSSYVSFEGHELLYTDPRVVAFLSCYPYWEGLGMDGGSSYSMGETSSTSSEQTVGMSVGVSFGFSVGVPTLAETKVKVSMEASLDYSTGKSHDQSISTTFSAGQEDKVVWTAIPYDVYYYKVIKSPYMDADKVITVSMPRAPIMTATELGYYNANNGEAVDIGSSNILTHSMGKPKSYPNPAFVKARLDDGSMVIYKDDSYIHPGNGKSATQVGVGSGSASIELSYSDSKETTIAGDISIKVEAESTVMGVDMGASVGFHYGYSYSVSSGETTAFSGEIGDISAAEAAAGAETFPFTLFVYQKPLSSDSGSESVLILEYCYEGEL